MSSSSQTKPGSSVGKDHPSNRTLRRVFVGERGIRAGWSALAFVAIYQVLITAAMFLIGHFTSPYLKGPIPLQFALLQEGCEALVVLTATWAMARVENCSLLSYGFTGDHKLIRLVSGVLWGWLCLSVVIAILWKAGWLVFDGLSLAGFAQAKYALAWLLVFLLVGVFEESMLRGYLQFTLSRGIGFWWSALLLSLAFALGHVGNGGESLLGLLEVGLGGLVFCLSLWYTKSLSWAVGFHAGWDWAQSYLYGTPDSGLMMKEHLFSSHAAGNPLWSGGTAGPEGSLLILPLLIVVAAGMWIWWGVRKQAAPSH